MAALHFGLQRKFAPLWRGWRKVMTAPHKASTQRRSNPDIGYLRYEQLKAELNAKASTPSEFEAACKKAARLAGV